MGLTAPPYSANLTSLMAVFMMVSNSFDDIDWVVMISGPVGGPMI